MAGEVKTAMIEVVNRIPFGRVTNFGEVAKVVAMMVEKTITAQVIGRQLSGLPESQWGELPWWRVIAKNGYVSSLKLGDKGWRQIDALKSEGIVVHEGYVDMSEYRVMSRDLMGF